jgi:hypothetical protein
VSGILLKNTLPKGTKGKKVYYNGESEDQREVRGGDRVYYNGDERKGGYVKLERVSVW